MLKHVKILQQVLKMTTMDTNTYECEQSLLAATLPVSLNLLINRIIVELPGMGTFGKH